ncbi:glycosyltransferase family 2 protein [Caldicellulosiruptor naganoensis]|uniref:Glycosyltransferase n=1 Tax=Caldicellulosiruptor naganoensis TaxID=29324 RepID=A0ABY7BMC7_9FIRM|nr:glycosyltransferase [Caldicellulosiruptor naganoensis]WAM32706.1 glycosyltransferase [Caldicellulosiruptor naganoensis]
MAVIIPAYNPPVSFYNLIEILSGFSFIARIIVVDDGSKEKIRLSNDKCMLLRHCENKGKGAALKTAFESLKKEKYDTVVLLDSDLRVDKKSIEKFLNNITLDRDAIIIGYPINVKKRGFGVVKAFAKYVVKFYTGKTIEHPLSGQRIIPFSAIEKIENIPKGYGVEVSMLIDFLKRGYEIIEVPFDFTHDEKGKSIQDLLHKLHQLKDIFAVFISKRWRL